MRRRILTMAIALIAALGMGGCGGGGGDGESGGVESSSLLTGRFEGVEGLRYRTSSGVSGRTDEKGVFQYREGDTVTFSAGNLIFGSVVAKPSVDAGDFRRMDLVLQSLHALDDDGNADNGIRIVPLEEGVVSESGTTDKRELDLRASRSIELEKIDDTDSRYVEFLKEHGTLLQAKQTALIAEFAREYQKSHPAKSGESFVHLIMTGAIYTPPFSRYAKDSTLLDYIEYRVDDETDGDNFGYRVNNVVLYKMMLETSRAQAEDAEKIMADQEAFDKQVNAFVESTKYTINSAFDYTTASLGTGTKATSIAKMLQTYAGGAHGERTLHYGIDMYMPEEMQDDAKLAVTIAYKCVKDGVSETDKKKALKSCALETTDALLNKIINEKFEEEYPVGSVWAKGLKDTLITDIKVYASCTKVTSVEEVSSCIQEVTNATLGKVLDASATVASIYHLGKGNKERNSKALAYEIFFSSRFYGEHIVLNTKKEATRFCYLGSLYGFDLSECRTEDDPLAFVLDKVIETGHVKELVPGVFGTDPGYDPSIVLETLGELEDRYQILYKEYYKRLKKRYGLADGGTNVWVYRQVSLEAPSLSLKKENGDGSVDLEVCFNLTPWRTIVDLSADAKILIRENGKEYRVNLEKVPAQMGVKEGTRTLCGTIENFAKEDVKEATLLLSNRASFRFHSGGKRFDMHNFTLYRYSHDVPEDLDSDPVVAFDAMYDAEKGLYRLHASFPGKPTYRYQWSITSDRPECSVTATKAVGTFRYDGNLLKRECLKSSLKASLKVVTTEKEYIGEASRPLDPIATPSAPALEIRATPVSKLLQAGESVEVTVTTTGKDVVSRCDNGFFKVEKVSSGTYRIVSSGASDVDQKATVTWEVEDGEDRKVATTTVSQLARMPDEPPTIATNLKDHKKPFNYYFSKIKNRYAQIETESDLTQRWWLQNLSDEPLYGVVLQMSPYCDSTLEHDRGDIVVGDLAPNESRFVELAIHAGQEERLHYCQWDIYAKDEEGKLFRLLWHESKKKASINYWLRTVKPESLPIPEPVRGTVNDLYVTQSEEGAWLSWERIEGVGRYVPMASLDFTREGVYADITASCRFPEGVDTRCLLPARYFKRHKVWYFGVSTDEGLMSEPVRFEWEERDVEKEEGSGDEPAREYAAYLAGRTLYALDADGVLEAWTFSDDLKRVTIEKEDGSYKKTVATAPTGNGLAILSGDSETDYWVIQSVLKEALILEHADITPSGFYISHNYSVKLYFNRPGGTGSESGGESDVHEGDSTPVVLIHSYPASVRTGGYFHIRLKISDADGNARRIAVVWGDGESSVYDLKENETKEAIVSIVHAYAKAGEYRWSAQAVDAKGQKSNILQGSIVVVDAELPSGSEDLKALLGGTVWYGIETKPEGYLTLTEFRFDSTMSRLDWRDIEGGNGSGSHTLEVTGNVVKVIDDEDESYFRVVDVESDYIVIESIDAVNGRMKLYRDLADAKAEYGEDTSTGTMADLSTLIVGKTFYRYCLDGDSEQMFRYIFGSDGVLTFVDYDGEVKKTPYRIEGDSVYTKEDSSEEPHVLKGHTDNSVTFLETDGSTTTFYTMESAARAAPSEGCGGDDGRRIEVSGIVSGRVLFYDENNRSVAVPADAWVGITPERYKRNWNRMTCRIEPTGTFGGECYIEEDEAGVREAFADRSETFQLVVFKNHVRPDEPWWNGGEDLYRFVGESVPHGSWSRIEVYLRDYQDRSDELGVGGSMLVADMVSGHVSFEDESGNTVAKPNSLWVRITPEPNQINDNWNGVNCRIESDGSFGKECYIHTDEAEMQKLFDSSYEGQYQIIFYLEQTGTTRWEGGEGEPSIGHMKKEGDVYNVSYGEWRNAVVVLPSKDIPVTDVEDEKTSMDCPDGYICRYDENGTLRRVHYEYNADGTVRDEYKEMLDTNGALVERKRTTYNPDGSMCCVEVEYFDPETSKVLVSENWSSDGGHRKTEYIYDETGRLTKYIYYLYDNKRLAQKKIHFLGEHGLEREEITTYDESGESWHKQVQVLDNGKREKEIVERSDGYKSEKNYVYDSAGQVVKIFYEYYESDGSWRKGQSTTNSRGNPLHTEESTSDGRYRISEHAYYENNLTLQYYEHHWFRQDGTNLTDEFVRFNPSGEEIERSTVFYDESGEWYSRQSVKYDPGLRTETMVQERRDGLKKITVIQYKEDEIGHSIPGVKVSQTTESYHNGTHCRHEFWTYFPATGNPSHYEFESYDEDGNIVESAAEDYDEKGNPI